MKAIKFCAICVLGAMMMISCSTKTSDEGQPAGITKAQVDSVSYALGQNFGMIISMNDFGSLNFNEIVAGMKDIFAMGKIDPQEANRIGSEFSAVINKFMEDRMTLIGEETLAKGKEFLENNAKNEGVVTTESGLQYKIEREGNGVFPTAESTVECNYEGTLIDGTVFDSSYERGNTATFNLQNVIQGWTEGLQLIDEGGEITLWIPADLAYGERGAGANIGPNETLKFKVELIRVVPEEE
ncbi:MAG TPA: FKBP-type peptidyl-prolyl cis-trans isomerase [Bacteroidales bacterium]|jgi:FKBP-type peptidyl-prolyl cis-trans isomerase FklB|nr:FKBP-type peptidyl-prolyl cis-trans isomerase [Bacteroidales bacterium]